MNENAFLQAKVATPLFETRVTHSQFTEKREYGKTASKFNSIEQPLLTTNR